MDPEVARHCASTAPKQALTSLFWLKFPRPPWTMKIIVKAVIIRTEAATIRANVWDIPLCMHEIS